MVEDKKAELSKGGGGTNAESKVAAEAEIVVRSPDGKVKSKQKATNTEVNL